MAWSSATCARAAREFGDRFRAARLLVLALLLRYGALRRFQPALRGGLGEIGLGLLDGHLSDAGVELRLCSEQFGVELRRVDRRERLSGFHQSPMSTNHLAT